VQKPRRLQYMFKSIAGFTLMSGEFGSWHIRYYKYVVFIESFVTATHFCGTSV